MIPPSNHYRIAVLVSFRSPGVPIRHSKDFVNWTQLGYVLDRTSHLNLDCLGISRGVFAPSIHYHDGTFYMISTLVMPAGIST